MDTEKKIELNQVVSQFDMRSEEKLNVKNLRRRLGWSQSDLARRLGTEASFIESLEHGELSADKQIISELELLEKQADQANEETIVHALADQILEENELEQCTNNDVTASL
jgi:ribosome-binding protein aMBF1 (putative translation factor)